MSIYLFNALFVLTGIILFLVVYLIHLMRNNPRIVPPKVAFFEDVLPRFESSVVWSPVFEGGIAKVKCHVELKNRSVDPALNVKLYWYDDSERTFNWKSTPLIGAKNPFRDVPNGGKLELTLECEVPSYRYEGKEIFDVYSTIAIEFEQEDGKMCEQILVIVNCMNQSYDHAGYVNRYDFIRDM